MTETTPPRFYTDADADPHFLDGHRVAVVGYGTLGRSIALNLRDSGVAVLVGNIEDGYADQAIADGFAPLAIAEAAEQADEVLVLLPDEVIPGCFHEDVAPRVRPGAAVCFASGYVLAYGLVTPPPGVDVLLLAPRMSGALVRERYLDGQGFFSCVAVEKEESGNARARLLALARAVGSLRRGAVELPAAKEALLDLLVEQTFGVYLGLSLQLAFRLGVEAGLPPEAMVLELYMSGEMANTIESFAESGFFSSLTNHGLTALYGGFIRTAEVDTDGMERMFRTAIEEIRDGTFAKRFQRELADGYPTVAAIREIIGGGDPISLAERRVRAALNGGDPD
ncbi:MAG: NAD(P)-binding domain-containing protein [Micromonosporaceae bacterium]